MQQPTSAEAMTRILIAARAGRLDEAADLAAGAHAINLGDPVICALAGAIAFRRGRFEQAIAYLEGAHKGHPNDMTVRSNLAESLYRCERMAEAMALCDDDSARADTTLRLARLGAHLANEATDHGRAINLYRHILTVEPNDWSAWNNMGNAMSAAGDYDGAVIALERAASLATDSPPIRINLGNALIETGRIGDAEKILLEAAECFPADPSPWLSLFAMYRDIGQEDQAYAAIRDAAARAPDQAAIQSDYGQEAARRNDYDIAERSFEAALILDAKLGPAYVGLASVYERMNREAELEPLHLRANANAVDAQSRAYIDALRFKRANDFDAAFAALELSGDVVVPGRKHHLRGIMLDRLGRHDDAFAAFEAMNAHWAEDPSQPRDRARGYREDIARATQLVTREWIGQWSVSNEPQERASPIFLVGFPRSGTTLLDTMLMADPRVRVLEEEPFIGEVEREIGGIDVLPDLTEAQICAARASYFNRVDSLVAFDPNNVIVDKHPMHLAKVPIIRRLFPEARFVLILRHPCDVVLSCFLTNFRINNAMANFLDLGDTATLYDQIFNCWDQARDLFDLPVGTIVYERLVEDTARELKPLFAWLGLEWHGDDMDHRDAARNRGTVRTASYAQVTEPVYQRAAGRWHRYSSQLNPIMPIIQSWVDRFGYALEDSRIPPWPDRPNGGA